MASKIFGGCIEGDSLFGASRYYTKLTQSSTGIPSSTTYINDFGATTFTWARTSAGIYTCTASTAVFTVDKTHVIPPSSTLGLFGIQIVVTSTTVLTVTTNLNVNVATILTAVPTDSLLTNSLFKVEVYD